MTGLQPDFETSPPLSANGSSHRLEVFAAMIGEETAKADSKVVKVLREEIAALRADVEILRAHKASRPDVNLAGVVPLRGRDVA